MKWIGFYIYQALAEEAKARYQDAIFKTIDLVSLFVQMYKVYLYMYCW